MMMKPRQLSRLKAAKNRSDKTPLEQQDYVTPVEQVDDDHTKVDGVEHSFRELVDDADRDPAFADSYDAAVGRARRGKGKVKPRVMSYSSKSGPLILSPRPLKPPGRK